MDAKTSHWKKKPSKVYSILKITGIHSKSNLLFSLLCDIIALESPFQFQHNHNRNKFGWTSHEEIINMTSFEFFCYQNTVIFAALFFCWHCITFGNGQKSRRVDSNGGKKTNWDEYESLHEKRRLNRKCAIFVCWELRIFWEIKATGERTTNERKRIKYTH